MYPIRVLGWLNMSIVSTKYGQMKVIDSDNLVSRSLVLYGEWAMDELRLLSQIISPGMFVLDVGSFIGTHSLAFSKYVGNRGMVYSFEPRKEIFDILLVNLSINNCKNVTAFNIGLAEKEKIMELQSIDLNEPINFGSLSLDSDFMASSFETYQINISTIDQLAIGKVNVIKIDVEGMEKSVLKGAEQTILRDRPLVLCECNSVTSGVEILTFGQKNQYKVFGFLSSAYNPNNFNAIKENFYGDAKELSLFLIPEEIVEETLGIISGVTLLPINNVEDLILPLLHKPQYPYEVLANTASYSLLGINYIAPIVVERDNQLSVLNQQLTKLGEELTYARQIVVERDNQLRVRNQQLTKLGEELTYARQIVVVRDDEIRKLISSKSFFITKPIRWIGRAVRGGFTHNKKLRGTKSNNNKKPNAIRKKCPVAVILPVYRDVEMTKRCILAAMPNILSIPTARIVAINDASPDDGMQFILEDFAKNWPKHFMVLQNQENLGFVKTVNKGLSLFEQYDVVLLNSDVVVPKNWLTRLMDEAYSINNIGTVTPFSNNATICSFPYFLQENFAPFNLDVDTIDAVFRAHKLPCAEAPTGVGFCMYIRRACLDEIGYLDEEKFGKGYGEENDLCQRALKKGWLNLLSPNIYAYHEGGASFSSDKQGLIYNAMHVLQKLHPNYHLDVQEFIKLDPLKSMRIQRYIELLKHIDNPKVLMVTHALGGGVDQHLQELNKYYHQSLAFLTLTEGDNAREINIVLGIDSYADRLVFNMSTDYAAMISMLKSIGISAVHFHHIIKLDLCVLNLPRDLNVPHIFTIHDYYYMHGNPTLTDVNGKYPGYYDEKTVNRLHDLSDGLTIKVLRDNFSQVLENAASVIFPSNSVKEIFTTIYPNLSSNVVPHIEADRDVFKKPTIFKKKKVYIIGTLGAICREKGADLLERVSFIAEKSRAPIKFKLLGYAYRPLKKLETTGAYLTKKLPDLISQQALDIIFFPAQWPETYSYTLSYALDSGLPIIAPDIGAFPERLSERVNTLIFNYNLSPEEILHLIKGFIKNLEMGNLVKAPKYLDDKSDYGYYESSYLKIISGKSKQFDDNTIDYNLNELTSYLHVSKRRGGALLALLIHLRMHTSSRWLSFIVPKKLRQKIVEKLNGSSVVSPQDLIK
jgi:FkbM family methyltransferase